MEILKNKVLKARSLVWGMNGQDLTRGLLQAGPKL